MRFPALALSVMVLCASASVAQTGFSTKTYPNVLPATSDNTRLLAADLNGDGRADLVSYGSRYSGSAPVNVFLNDGSGGFLAPHALTGSAGMLVQTGDMNGDGYPDIIGCANIGSGQNQNTSVTVYLNNGTGGFTAKPAATGLGNTECNALTLADVFQNGHLDVVTAGFTPGQYDPGGKFFPGNNNAIQVFSNDGTGTVTLRSEQGAVLDSPSNSTFTNCGAIDVVAADFLQNGKSDLVVTSTCQPKGQNLPGNAGTTFLLTETKDQYGNESYTDYKFLQSQYANYVNGKVLDVNRDGKPDVIFAASEGGHNPDDLVYMKNIGSGSFTFTSLFNNLVGSSYTAGATVADFNGDGINDVAASYNNTNSPPVPTMTILAGTKSGTFTDSQNFSTGTGTQSAGDVASADLNGDGKPDLATLVYDTSNRTTGLNVYTNTQGGSSNACSAPTTANTNTICSPASGSTENSPVTVNAASNVSGFTLNRLYLDNKSVYQTTSQEFSTPINAANGNHTLVLVSYNNAGKAFTSNVNFTVGTATGNGCLPSSAGVSICSPSNGSADNSPITLTAGAHAQNGNITAIRVYVDNVARFTVTNPSASPTFQINQGGLDFGGGSHHLVVVGYQSTGGSVSSSITFSEPSGPCMAPTTGTSLKLCTPAEGSTVSSPFTVSANAYTPTGYIAAMRVYIDNAAVALINNSQKSQTFTINQPVSAASGKHSLVVVAYPSGGGSLSVQEGITVQ